MLTQLKDWPDIQLFEVSSIRPSDPVSGRIPDLKIGEIIRPDIWCIPPQYRITTLNLARKVLTIFSLFSWFFNKFRNKEKDPVFKPPILFLKRVKNVQNLH
jgi:hypothetical protein